MAKKKKYLAEELLTEAQQWFDSMPNSEEALERFMLEAYMEANGITEDEVEW